MLICPKCNSEYENGCTICSDCQCELIEKPDIEEEVILSSRDKEFKKIKKSIIMAMCLFLGGSIIAYMGLTKGMDMAGILSRPKRAVGWIIPENLILGCTYTPIIIGVALILMSINIFTVLFIKWINREN